jgi:GAF domain-containing protein
VPAAEAALFAIWNEFNEEYQVADSRGMERQAWLPLDDPLASLLADCKAPTILMDLASDERLSPPKGSPYEGRSLVAAPLMLQDRMLGFLALVNEGRAGAFAYSHMVLLSAVAGYASVAVENLRHMQAEIDRARLLRGKSTVQPL